MEIIISVDAGVDFDYPVINGFVVVKAAEGS